MAKPKRNTLLQLRARRHYIGSIDSLLRMRYLHQNQQFHDNQITELMARQDRQGKWIAFLLLAWIVSSFMWFGVLVV